MMPDYDRAARLAYKSLLALHITKLPVDPLMILRHCKRTAVHAYSEICGSFGYSSPDEFALDFMGGMDALTVRRERAGAVFYEVLFSDRGNYNRRRFTLAHELGHIVLKHTQQADFEEREADYYAAQLLAPRPLIEKLPRDPVAIEQAFQISHRAAEMALRAPLHHRDIYLYTIIENTFTGAICQGKRNSA